MKRENKGIFSDARLPIALRYVIPESRRRMIVAGLLGCLVVAAGFALTLAFAGPRVLSPGPVSSQHANFERNCAACHTSFRAVASESCLVCHARASRGKGGGFERARQGCLSCHRAEGRGEHFQPVRFESHCAGCHLSSGAATARLPIAQPGAPQAAGVWTLDAIAAQEGGSAAWVATTNPAEFQQTGGKLGKRPGHHADPWAPHNLLRIRRQLHPRSGLAELLPTNVGAGGGVATEPLYLQAI